MLNKIVLGAAASLSALVAMPGAAQADHDGYYDRGDYRYDRRAPQRYRPGDYYRGGYNQGYGQQGYYGRGYNQGYYGRSTYDRGYDRRGYGYDDRYYGQRCGSGTTGAIIGGAAGALVGREVARDGRRSRYSRRGGDGTVGAIVGGAIGALVGREIDRSC